MIWENIILLLVALTVVVYAAQWMVKSLTKISRFLHISEFSAAFLLVAISTSLPELFVGITASLEGVPDLSFGNVVGSNIVNLTLIAGLGVLLARGYSVKTKEVRKDSMFMLAFALLPMLLLFIGNQLSRLDGVILVLAFLAYMIHIIREGRKHHKLSEDRPTKWEIVLAPFILVVGLAVLFFGSDFAVKVAQELAIGLNVAPLLIGTVLVAIGTSLPELSFTITTFMEHKGELSLGNLIGSVIANASLVLGVTAIIAPIATTSLFFWIGGGFMLFTTFLFVTFLESGNKLSQKEGISLVLLYLLFLVVQLYIPFI